jgi:branched-chain amino acid transport system substrate-binding protein
VSTRSHTRLRVAGLLVAATMMAVTSACGSRLSSEEIQSQSIVEGTSGRSTAGAAATGAEGDAFAAGGGYGTSLTPAAAAADSAGVTGGATPGGGAAASGGPKAPIVIGYIGWLSGTGGETMSPSRDVWVAWSKMINAKGGINGHPVQLLVGDMGGNPSRGVAVARDFVENKGAIVLTLGGVNGAGIPDYAKSKGIPIVGSVPTTGQWHNNPMMFPPWGSTENNAWATARAIKRSGKTKMAQVYCAESPDCQDGVARTQRWAKEEGVEIVATIRYSVTAPDYTAECLQMRGSGAEFVYPTGDTGSMIRMAKACARQNFRPAWISPTMDDNVAANPEFEGAVAITPAFPWFLRSGSPAVEEYASAMGKYAPSRLTRGNIFMAQAWASAKTLEKAAQKLDAKPTTQNILDGLWSMKGETLGGLTTGKLAITFTRGQPTPERFCYFDAKLVGGKWTAPSGLTPICR